MALEVNQAEFQKEVLQAEGLVLVDFWAPWCVPCRMQAPILEAFGAANANVKIVKVNVNDNPDLAEKYGIMSIPSLLLFKNGELIKSAVGLHRQDALAELIK